MPIPDSFIDSNGALNADGRKLHAFIEAQFAQLDRSDKATMVRQLNNMAGTFQWYFANVVQLESVTPEQFMADFSHSYARSAWQIMEAVEEQDAKTRAVEEAGQQQNVVAQELESVKGQLAEALAAIKTLQEARPEAKPEPAKKPAKAEAVEEGEAE